MTNVNQSPEVSGKPNILKILADTPKTGIPDVPLIAKRFRDLYGIIHPGAKAEMFYQAEKFHFAKVIVESKSLQECTGLSLYGCWMDTAVNGLSFDPSFKHQYMVAYNHNAGTKASPVWEKRAQIQISGPGELLLRTKQGQIKYADNPVLVYEGDDFKYGTKDGNLFIEHMAALPSKTQHIIACYMRIVKGDGSVDHKIITENDMARFGASSKDPNSKAWVESIGGMWLTKCIKHAFKTYPKVRTGNFSQLQTNTIDAEHVDVTDLPDMIVPDKIDYGTTDVPEMKVVESDNSKPLTVVSDDQAFEEPKVARGIQHTDTDDF